MILSRKLIEQINNLRLDDMELSISHPFAIRCTKVLDFGHKGEPIFCGRVAVLQTSYSDEPYVDPPHEEYACEEHAPELAQLSGIEWHPERKA